ncbi:MAG: hypothetical protein JXA33_22165 [Anaerolineae bacterium]|nr:hypothetical protein [Anaerolineae bacterium]
MSRNVQRWLMIGICLLSLFAISANKASFGENEGTIRGATFLDKNRNGKMDVGEEGVGWVYFTITQGEYSHTYYSEWRTTDEDGHTYATGTFGPAPLPMGYWKVNFSVPQGYLATTPAEQTVYVPGRDGGHVGYVYMGLYPTSGRGAGVLPSSGANPEDPTLRLALSVLGVGALLSTGLGIRARRRA